MNNEKVFSPEVGKAPLNNQKIVDIHPEVEVLV